MPSLIIRLVVSVLLIEIFAISGWVWSSTESLQNATFFITVSVAILYLNYLSYVLRKEHRK